MPDVEAIIEVDDPNFQRNLALYAKKKLKGDFAQAIRAAARIAAVALAHGTNPFGDSEEARSQGYARAYMEAGRVYATPGKVFMKLRETDPGLADAFWYFHRTGKNRLAEQLMHSAPTKFQAVPFGPFDPAYHVESRDPRTGRVHAHAPVRQVVTNTRSLEAYRTRKANNAGRAKAVWAACARELGGTRGIPQWVTRHKMREHEVSDQSKAEHYPGVVLASLLHYARESLSAQGKRNAFSIARGRLMKFLEMTLKEKYLDDKTPVTIPTT